MDEFFSGKTDAWTIITIAAMAGITVLSRSFFFISKRDWVLPHWAQRGLQYAPIAALAAVVVPELVMAQGALIQSLQDARLFAGMAGIGYFFWRKGAGQVVLGTIVTGMAVYLPLHIGLGW